jgi:hypothetical protein
LVSVLASAIALSAEDVVPMVTVLEDAMDTVDLRRMAEPLLISSLNSLDVVKADVAVAVEVSLPVDAELTVALPANKHHLSF